MFLRQSYPTLFIAYQGVVVAALGTGIASALADPSTIPPPILASFYAWLPITMWGWVYTIVGVVLFVGLFRPKAAVFGLWAILTILIVRLGFQVWQAFAIWREGATWRELLPTIAGLPILYAFVSSVFSMAMQPFSDMIIVRSENENGNG